MTLSQELTWRGFVNQTTYKDITVLDGEPITFYWGVDPSADSMTIGNLAIAMMVRHFMEQGHKAVLLVGGATGLIGDPDGKSEERELKSPELVAANKAKIIAQYQTIFKDLPFEVVDNYDWFKDFNYLQFLREVGKHVPVRQMIGRDFVQSRLGEDGSGISYAEFSYSLIQGYDFLHLHRELGVTLQVCGSDQWGNCIAGVDLTRRVTGDETHVWSAPLIINKTTGVKFGKSEGGAIWLDPVKTTPTQFYQFWINCDDEGVEDYLKIYTLEDEEMIAGIMQKHAESPGLRVAQRALALAVTILVHGSETAQTAQNITDYLTGQLSIAELDDDTAGVIAQEIPTVVADAGSSIIEVLVASELATSNTEARRLLTGNAISINGQKTDREQLQANDFQNGRLLLRRGKAFKDSALVTLG